jgi:hypothetical protein
MKNPKALVRSRFYYSRQFYRSGLASLARCSGTGLGYTPVQKQLAEQRRQPAAAATMIAKSAIALEDERADLIKGRDDLESLGTVLSDYDDQSWHDIYQTWPDRAYRMSDARSTLIAILHRTNERNASGKCIGDDDQFVQAGAPCSEFSSARFVGDKHCDMCVRRSAFDSLSFYRTPRSRPIWSSARLSRSH